MKEALKVIVFGLLCFFLGWISSYSYFHYHYKKDWKPKHCIQMFNHHYGKVSEMLGIERVKKSDKIEEIKIRFKKGEMLKTMVCTYNDGTGVWGVQEEK